MNLDEKVAREIGRLVLQILQLQLEIEALRLENEKLKRDSSLVVE